MEALLEEMSSGHLSLVTGVAWVGIAWVMSMIGGALTGLAMAGEDIGNELSTLMGGMFGTTIGAPAALLGLLLLQVL